MIVDGVPASDIPSDASIIDKAISSFLIYIERRLGVLILRKADGPARTLFEPLRLGALLKQKGIVESFERSPLQADMPRVYAWKAFCKDAQSTATAGMTLSDDAAALYAALAEALERYIWLSEDDYFLSPRFATASEITAYGASIAPERFAGFSAEQRAGNIDRTLDPEAKYLWILAESHVTGKSTYVPAQVISGKRLRGPDGTSWKEPLLRQRITNGLASWPTKVGARLAGLLEILEREAYMVMWLNQLTLPRIPLSQVRHLSLPLKNALDSCERYRLRPHVVRMLTDAPAHAIAVVLEDLSGHAPRFSIGLRTHRNLGQATEKALTEALRAHKAFRIRASQGLVWDPQKPVAETGHRERVDYWGLPENAKHLEFLISGPEEAVTPAQWDEDTDEEHFARLIAWCRDKGFECFSVSLGRSAKNPTRMQIEMTVIPDLQPSHLEEDMHAFGSDRWKEIPKLFGYAHRKSPFIDRPHPFS